MNAIQNRLTALLKLVKQSTIKTWVFNTCDNRLQQIVIFNGKH